MSVHPSGFVGGGGSGSSTTAQTIYETIIGSMLSNGVDGEADLDGTNTVLWATKSGNTYTVTRVANCNNIRNRAVATLDTNNFHGPYARGLWLNEGHIQNDGLAAVGQTGGLTKAAGTFQASPAGGNGGNAGAAGAAGGASTGGRNPTTGRWTGGAGGGGSGGVGGASGALTPQASTRGNLNGGPALWGRLNLSQTGAACPTYGSGGGGGGGSGGGVGGGGGGAAGGMQLGGGRFINNGTITADGGAGAAGANAGAGGGGGGGAGDVAIVCGSYSGTGTITATGGPGGASGGAPGIVGATGLEGSVDIWYPLAA